MLSDVSLTNTTYIIQVTTNQNITCLKWTNHAHVTGLNGSHVTLHDAHATGDRTVTEITPDLCDADVTRTFNVITYSELNFLEIEFHSNILGEIEQPMYITAASTEG